MENVFAIKGIILVKSITIVKKSVGMVFLFIYLVMTETSLMVTDVLLTARFRIIFNALTVLLFLLLNAFQCWLILDL
jgi:E3 ubiquitin-protein ligase DOA10